jgi:hypothetical protein
LFQAENSAREETAACVSIRRPLVRRLSEWKRRWRSFLDRSILSEHAPTSRSTTMRVMVMIKATKNSEAGVMPSEQTMRFMVLVKATAETEKGMKPSDAEMLTAMGKFNEELVKAGVMLAGDGLHPSRRGKRLRFSGGTRTVIDGPFAETKELVAGFWIWQVKSIEEAVEWMRRCPDPMPGEDAEVELRPVFEAEDFGAELTPELRAQDARLRAELDGQRKA